MRIPDIVPKCAGFLMYSREGMDRPTLAGTCFLVQYQLLDPKLVALYVVTAHHVIANIIRDSVDGKVWVRVNMQGGGVCDVESNATDWWRHPDDSSVDVAAIPWGPDPLADGRRLEFIPVGVRDLFATPDVIEQEGIGIGDDLVITGLFPRFVGSKRNMAIVCERASYR